MHAIASTAASFFNGADVAPDGTVHITESSTRVLGRRVEAAELAHLAAPPLPHANPEGR